MLGCWVPWVSNVWSGNQLWQSHRSVAKIFLHIPGFGKLKNAPITKKKHSTVAGGLFKKDNLFVTPTQIFRQWPTWNLGRFSVSAFFCASTDLRWATRSFHRSATPHVPDPSSSEQGQRPPIHQWNTQATHPGPLMKGNKRRWMKSLEGWELSLNFFQPATKRRWMWKQLRKILPKAGS